MDGSSSDIVVSWIRRRSVRANDDEVGQLSQTQCPCTAARRFEPIERCKRLTAQAVGALACGRETKHGHVRGLVPLRVLAGCLAQHLRTALYVEDVIDDLERKPDRTPITIQRGECCRIGAGCDGAHAYRSKQQRASFFSMHGF